MIQIQLSPLRNFSCLPEEVDEMVWHLSHCCAMAKICSVPVIVATLVCCHLSTSHPGGYSVIIIEAKCRVSDSQ